MKKRFPKIFFAIFLFLFLFQAGLYSHENGKTVLLETIGGLSAQALYLTYVSIGTTADGFAYKAFNKKTTSTLINEYISLSKNSRQLLNKLLIQKTLTGSDAGFVKEMIEAYGLLIEEAQAFGKYVSTGKQSHIQVYDQKRKQAWKKIAKVLNIK